MNSVYTVSIFIDSSQRTSGDEYDFTAALPEQLSVREVRVEKIIIPFSFYIFNSNTNRLIVNWNSNGNVNIDITPGNYNSTTLAAELKTRMDAAIGGTTWTITYSETTGKFTFVSASADFVFDSSGSANSLLGISTAADETSSSSSLTVSGVASLTGDNYIVVKSTALTSDRIYEGTFSDTVLDTTIQRVAVDVNPFGVILDSSQSSLIYSTAKKLQNIDLQLFDAAGNALDLNGRDWSIHLTAHTYRHTNPSGY